MNLQSSTQAHFSYSCPFSPLVPTPKDGHECEKRARVRLALVNLPLYCPAVAAKSATGFGDPYFSRRISAPIEAGAFFVPNLRLYGGCARDTFGYAGCLESRFANLRTATTQNRLATVCGSSSTLGATPMTTLIPSKIRALAHRRMALSALRANSSLSVRLSRYNVHMEKARILEAVGGVV